MSDSIITALITAAVTLIGVLINSRAQHAKVMAELDKHMAVTDTKIDELTREVRAHNGHSERITTLEAQAVATDRRVSELERRAG